MSEGVRAAIEIRRSVPGDRARWWLAADKVYVDEPANRLLFATLLGKSTVLGVEAGACPRGLPTDVTADIEKAYSEWGSAAIAASWASYHDLAITVERIGAAAENTDATEGQKEQFRVNQIGASIRALLSYLAAFEANSYETRLVFWSTLI